MIDKTSLEFISDYYRSIGNDRNADICLDRANGFTFKRISEKYSLSVERVRQITVVGARRSTHFFKYGINKSLRILGSIKYRFKELSSFINDRNIDFNYFGKQIGVKSDLLKKSGRT